MEVTIKLFAGLRERARASELVLALPDGARVADALARLGAITEGVPVVMAVNQAFADDATALHPGDELALIPPVSGGATAVAHVRITDAALDLTAIARHVADPRAGAIVTFTGVTREVDHLQYEAYVEMAERQLRAIVQAAITRHGLTAAAAEHRVGRVALSEASVAVAASAPHRAQAFDGAREIIDEIKARAPIWKREAGEWVAGTVPAPPPGP